MTRRKQKQIERYVLNEFLKKEPLKIPIFGIDEMETPDFVLKSVNKKISVEHTRFMRAEQKQIEEFRKHVIQEASGKFEKQYSDALSVYVHYTRKVMSLKEHPKSFFVDLIYNLVKDIYEKNRNHNFVITTKKNVQENNYFNRISVSNKTENNLWQWIGSHLVEYADLSKIQKLINLKSKLIKNYELEVDEKWLLIEAGKGFKSSSYRFDHLRSGELSKVDFDEVFLFDSGTREIFEV